MGGIRLGGLVLITRLSPPFTAYDGVGAPGDESPQVFRWSSTDAPGEAGRYTDFIGFTDADQCHNPVLSPDETQILFEVTGSSSGFREIWVTDNVPGSTPTQLVADGSNYVIHPFWGADSDTFVYVHCAGGTLNGGTIYKDNVSAIGSPTSLKAATGGRSPFRPKFNFDGTRVAYVFAQDVGSGSGQLRVMDDDGTNDASLFGTLNQNRFDNPSMFSWANTINMIAFEDGAAGSNAAYVINDDGTGQVQINTAGDVVGAATTISSYAWPPDDSYVILTANDTDWRPYRAELDGSDTTYLGTIGAEGQNYFKDALVYRNRIWMITATDAAGGKGIISSMTLAGTGEEENFDSSLGAGDVVQPFVGGDGWYYN